MSLPNIRMKTLGGPTWWDTIDSRKGFKLQQHIITGHFRILDPSNYRIDWGVDEGKLRSSFYGVTRDI